MAFLPAVKAELVIHPMFAFLSGDPAGGVGVGAGNEGLSSRSGLVLVLRRPEQQRRRWGRRRRGRGQRRRAGRFAGTTGSVREALATLVTMYLFLAFPVTVVNLENMGFETGEGGDSGRVTKTKVLAEVAGAEPEIPSIPKNLR